MTAGERFRILSVTLISMLIILCLGFGVIADAPIDEYSSYRSEIPNYDEIYELLYTSATEGETVVLTKGLNIDDKYIVGIFTDLVSSSPELFYLNRTLSYQYSPRGESRYINRVYFSYSMQGKELKEAQKTYEEWINHFVSLVDPSMTDLEKALWFHDYILSFYSYDISKTIYDVYGLIMNETGVCRATSLLYSAVMNRLGIDCTMVISDEMVHAWNIIKIDGKWYHVDLTFDDPLYDRLGRVGHGHFLLSDEEIASAEKGSHTDWHTSISCSEPFKGPKPWDGVNSRMSKIGDRWYYVDNEDKSVKYISTNCSEKGKISDINSMWFVSEAREIGWVGSFSSAAEYGGKLYWNSADEIFEYDPSLNTIRTVWRADESEQIISIAIFNDQLCMQIGFNVNEHSYGHIKKVPMSSLYSTVTLPFDDVPGNHPWIDSIVRLYEAGVFTGVSEKKFAPSSSLTRGMFVTILGRLSGVKISNYYSSHFDDVIPGRWYSYYVEWAFENNIIDGMGDSRFAPEKEISREQMFKILADYISNFKTELSGQNDQGELSFPDASDISSWARPSFLFCISNGIIDVKSGEMLRPQDSATRAEAAFLIDLVSKYPDIIQSRK